MNDQTSVSREEGQKTVVAFIAGLLIGGLLVWVFATPGSDEVADMADDDDNSASVVDSSDDNNSLSTGDTTGTDSTPAPSMSVGSGDLEVSNQPAGSVVTLGDVTFPNDEGWVGVRDYNNGQMTGLLGVARWSNEQGLIPTEVELLRATEAGSTYAVVFYSESGDREFSLADDVQLEAGMTTFMAQ